MSDTRDSKTYVVAQLADGQCWMTTPLRLALSSSTTLTPANTDLTANWTPQFSSQTGAGIVWNKGEERSYANGGAGYYTWYTATANRRGSICAKGWRLPNNSNYSALLSTYLINNFATDLAYAQRIRNLFGLPTWWYNGVNGTWKRDNGNGAEDERWAGAWSSEAIDPGRGYLIATLTKVNSSETEISGQAWVSSSSSQHGVTVICTEGY